MEASFKPSHSMVTLYHLYLLMSVTPAAAIGFTTTYLVYIYDSTLVWIPPTIFFTPMILIAGFVSYWIRKYYDSVSFQLTGDEVIVERGVWWRMKHTVPYARIMSVDVIQGPLSRKLGMATVDIYTAGYTGVRGGGGGPVSRRAEASIMHISNFSEVRERVLSKVRSRPLFGAWGGDISADILSELRKIRELLEKSES